MRQRLLTLSLPLVALLPSLSAMSAPVTPAYPTTRTIDVTVNDGATTPVVRTISIDPVPINDAPVMSVSGVTPA